MLEIRHLNYQVSDEGGQADILKDLSLTIEDNKFVVITGPNGGGKTTLAKAIMGLVKPTSGQILYNGADITDLSITERARLGVSYGFQQPPRFEGLRVRDLLELANDWASDGGCEEHEPEEITREQFMERLEPDAVQISGDGSFDFWFNDGALFWGHSIHVTGSLEGGPEKAEMEG